MPATLRNGLLLSVLASPVATLHRLETPDPDPTSQAARCTCRNWREMYSSKWLQEAPVTCGAGHELHEARKSGDNMMMAKVKYCWGFYEKLDHNLCVNIGFENAPGRWDDNQWCYTSPLCMSSTPANGTWNAGVKKCRKAKDNMLRYLSPSELYDLWLKQADTPGQGIDFQLLLRMAYPVERQIRFEHAIGFMEGMTNLPKVTQKLGEEHARRELSQELKKVTNTVIDNLKEANPALSFIGHLKTQEKEAEPEDSFIVNRLKDIQNRSYPVLIDSIYGKPPLGVTYRNKRGDNEVWIMDPIEKNPDNPHQPFTFECKMGCPTEEASGELAKGEEAKGEEAKAQESSGTPAPWMEFLQQA